MGELTVSVRGEATRTVAPDQAVLQATIRVRRDTKAAALSDAAHSLDGVTASLEGLGAVPLTPETRRSPMTYWVHTAETYRDRELDKATGRQGPVQVLAAVGVNVAVRDLGRLTDVDSALAAVADLDVNWVRWEVDGENPAWRQVRAEAIEAAMVRGRDYAAALGATVLRVDQIADAGLLGGRDAPAMGAVRPMAYGAAPDTLTLTAVPQELTAAVEARLIATAPS